MWPFVALCYLIWRFEQFQLDRRSLRRARRKAKRLAARASDGGGDGNNREDATPPGA